MTDASSTHPTESVICWDDARRRVGHKESLLVKLARLVLQEMPQRESSLREAVQQGDATRIAKAAHKIDGALATVGARQAARHAAEIETAARAGELETARALLLPFCDSLQAVTAALSDYVNNFVPNESDI